MVKFTIMGQISLIPILGFVFAAVVSHAVALLYGDRGLYQYRLHNRFEMLTSFCIAMFAGPYLTTRHAIGQFQHGQMTSAKLAAMAMIVGVWSFCAGIAIVQWLMVVGLINLP